MRSWNLDFWHSVGFPSAVLSAVAACKSGVKRAHLIDYNMDGGLLLELYNRDGVQGVCMISTDFFEASD